MPNRMVTIIPPGSLRGIINFAIAPATRPMTHIHRKCKIHSSSSSRGVGAVARLPPFSNAARILAVYWKRSSPLAVGNAGMSGMAPFHTRAAAGATRCMTSGVNCDLWHAMPRSVARRSSGANGTRTVKYFACGTVSGGQHSGAVEGFVKNIV